MNYQIPNVDRFWSKVDKHGEKVFNLSIIHFVWRV